MKEETIAIRRAAIAKNIETILAGPFDNTLYDKLIDVPSISDAVEAGIPLKEVINADNCQFDAYADATSQTARGNQQATS